MYKKEELHSLASFHNILKLLKKDPHFNHFCTQHKMVKGFKYSINQNKNNSYLLESGFLSCSFNESFKDGLFFIVKPGKFASISVIQENTPYTANFKALTEVIYWEIDNQFLRKMLLMEDPRNYILLNYLVETRRRMYILARKNFFSSEKRIYFALQRCAEVGIHFQENQIQLPMFITYELLSQLASTSKSYTSRVLYDLRTKGVLESSKKPWIIKDFSYVNSLLDSYKDIDFIED